MAPEARSVDTRQDVELQKMPSERFVETKLEQPTSLAARIQADDSRDSTTDNQNRPGHIVWAADAHHGQSLRIPSPLAQEKGMIATALQASEANPNNIGVKPYFVQPGNGDTAIEHDEDAITTSPRVAYSEQADGRPLQKWSSLSARARETLQNGTSSASQTELTLGNYPQLSASVTIGRNSNFSGMNAQDREELGGIEYRSLKLLLKIILGLLASLHMLGYIGLVIWIFLSPAKYRQYLGDQGVGLVWWAFYSTETMVSNCGLSLTPDSMMSFRDATWPMVLMTFLAFSGNTCYPIILRFIIWALHKMLSRRSSLQESLRFLLDHPRRCYTLLFPSNTTWILSGILFALNFVDVLLIIVMDLDNPEVNTLPMASRILAATFQAASSRHTGTSTFNLAKVNPGVQFSLLTMMYISVFPIAMSVRGTNTYEDTALGKYATNSDPEDTQSKSSYMMQHIRNQLGFDLWYVFLGTFCICAAEADKIMDRENAAFTVFAILFESVSAYGNVGLSLGTSSTLTSLSGEFSTFSKTVIVAVMWRGRHRGLPYALDHAVMLPEEDFLGDEDPVREGSKDLR
jgi:potassium uptake Trk family protein